MKTQLVWQAMNAIVEISDWGQARSTFVMLFGTVMEINSLLPDDELSLEAQGLLHWWNNCTGDYLANYELFISVVAMGLIDELSEAWNSTRSELPKAPEILHDGMPDGEDDPNVSGAGAKSSRKKSQR